MLTHIILSTTLLGRGHYNPHFKSVETKARKILSDLPNVKELVKRKARIQDTDLDSPSLHLEHLNHECILLCNQGSKTNLILKQSLLHTFFSQGYI